MTSTEWRNLSLGKYGDNMIFHDGRWFALAGLTSILEPGPTGFRYLVYYRLDFESSGIVRTMLRVSEHQKVAYMDTVEPIRPTTALGETTHV